jgi:hypothetical protein
MDHSDDNHIKLLSGGSVYKIHGGEINFLTIVLRILKTFPMIDFYFVGTGELDEVKKFIMKNGISNRFVLLGNRSDIHEIIKRCDIYLGSYPLSGGLMTQLAAYCSRPIIAFTDSKLNNRTEDFLSEDLRIKLTYTSIDEFFEALTKLVEKKEFREMVGKELLKAVPKKGYFEATLNKHLKGELQNFMFKDEVVNIQNRFEVNLKLNSFYQNSVMKLLLKNYPLMSLYLFPHEIVRMFKKLIKSNLTRITRK